MHWNRLEAGPVPPVTWGEFLGRLRETIEDYDYDEVVLTSTPATGGVGRSNAVVARLAFHVERVIIDIPSWVAWVETSNPLAQAALAEWRWHLWARVRPALWNDESALVIRIERNSQVDLIITWAASTPGELARALVSVVHDALQPDQVTQLTLEIRVPNGQARVPRL
jgi:hypothetical protein